MPLPDDAGMDNLGLNMINRTFLEPAFRVVTRFGWICFLTVILISSALAGDFLSTNMDTAVLPGEDFFDYANSGWLKRHPIPPSESRWGIGNVVREELYTRLRSINEQAAASANATGSELKKIGDFWTTAMDTNKAEQLGLTPLRAELQRIDAIQTEQDVLNTCFALQPIGVTPFFGFSVAQDEKASDVMSIHLAQGGLGLPERDFYFNEEKGVANIRKEYIAHITRTLKLLGRSEADASSAATSIMKFETALAKVSRKLEDLRDPERNYNKMSPAELMQKHIPAITWNDRFLKLGLHADAVIVGQPEFFDALDGLLKATPVNVLKDYLQFHLVSEYAPTLSKKFDEEHFAFYSQVLSGQKEPRPRWKRVLDAQDEAMGMVLGRIFVKEYFSEKTKQRYVSLVEAIRVAYRERISRLDWMSDATKAKAQSKLASLTSKVGYPDKWKDYSALVIGTNSYAENMMNAARWSFNDMLSKFGKPVDRTEWEMTPQTYNAYYKPENNEIVLPAAQFMIPGVADSDVDDAVAYGYTGASTIGHEITHGFDDEGRQFDAKGNLTDWWTTEDDARFKKHAEAMVQQFNAYEPLPGLHINGQASLGENIADFGGLLLGLDAFKKTEQYKNGEKVAGLTPMQRFFLGYALGWLTQQREESLRRNLLSDVHAPAKWRVLGPMSNVPEFYEAFGVKTNQALWRPAEARVRIW
jgi:putative endopeptidase